MKGLNQFQVFDWNRFAEKKTFIVTGVSEWNDYQTHAHLGTKLDCIIATDNTSYKFREGESFTNRYEKICFKISKDVKIPLGSRVIPRDVSASIYGDYKNMLAVKALDVVVPTKEKD